MSKPNITLNVNGPTGADNKHRGTTAERPVEGMLPGFQYFDTTLGMPIWWKGRKWVTAEGFTPAIKKGTTTQMQALISGSPTILGGDDEGYEFFNTTEGYPCYLRIGDGVIKWVKADGTDAPTE